MYSFERNLNISTMIILELAFMILFLSYDVCNI